MGAPFSIQGLDHVVIRVRDVAAVERFYRRVLGCTVDNLQPALDLTQLRAGSTLIDLLDVTGPVGRKAGAPSGNRKHNMDHFCLRIDPFDGAAIQRHLKAHGVTVIGEIAPRYGADGRGPSIYIRDPEGNQVELKGPPVSDSHTSPSAGRRKGKAPAAPKARRSAR